MPGPLLHVMVNQRLEVM